MIKQLKEGERVTKEIEQILTWVSELQPEQKKKCGWFLFGVFACISHYILFSKVGINAAFCIVKSDDSMRRQIYQIYKILRRTIPLFFIFIGCLIYKRNQSIDKFNSEQIKRMKENKKTEIMKVKKQIENNKKVLEILPPKCCYSKAFREVAAYIENDYAISIDEAAERYVQTKWREDMISGIRTITAQFKAIDEYL